MKMINVNKPINSSINTVPVSSAIRFLSLLLLGLTLSACSSNQNVPADANAGAVTGGGVQQGQGGQSGAGHPNAGAGGGYPYPNAGAGGSNKVPPYNAGSGSGNGNGSYDASLLNKKVIYFDYDSTRINPDDLKVITAHARYLAKQSGRSVRLEGHADERGSREYNVALSVRRAEAVARVFRLEGSSGTRLKTIGYGEEVPAVLGHNSASWDKNRRVEIKY
ncbi:MAG TPA: peptidoglycan-associated lipoprotein [Thiothrix sp.]|nr:peptidoglycan-associated lipoprotein [Thiothrix sp.]